MKIVSEKKKSQTQLVVPAADEFCLYLGAGGTGDAQVTLSMRL